MLADSISWPMASWSLCVPHGAWLLPSCVLPNVKLLLLPSCTKVQLIVNWFRRALRVRPSCVFRSLSLHFCNGVRISHFCFVLYFYIIMCVLFNSDFIKIQFASTR
jgi:hypothetical protein